MALQHLRSGTAHKRPIPSAMSAGQIALNTNEASPGLFFKDSNGDLVKVGPVHIGTSAPNSSPDSLAATALVSGTVYQILTVGTTDFTSVGASANTVGTVFTATGAGTGTGTVSGQQGVEKGEQWLDTTGGAYDLKIYDGTAWRSQAGEFVNVTGDTLTGALLLDNAASAAAPDLSFDGDADTGIYSPGSNALAIATGGNQRVYIGGAGSVGIGTSNPAYKLTIADSSAAALSLARTNGGEFRFVAANDTDGHMIRFGGSSDGGAVDPRILRFVSSGNAERLRIHNDGAVSIGTTATNGLRLTVRDVNTDFDADQATPTSVVHISGGSTTGVGQIGGSISLSKVSSTQPGAVIGAVQTTTDPDQLGLAIFTHPSSNSNNEVIEQVRIKHDGKVGIGTTSPETDLHVSDTDGSCGLALTSSTTGTAYIDFGDTDDRNAGLIQYNNSNNAMTFRTSGSGEDMRINSSGQVGIGTSSPNRKLEVAGNGTATIRLTDTDTALSDEEYSSGIEFYQNDASGPGVGASIRALGDGSTGNLQLTVNTGASNEALRIIGNGNVGIGTTSPSAKLDVSKSGSGYPATIELTNTNASGDGNTIRAKRGLVLEADYDNNSGNSQSNILFKTDNAERMRILYNGGVTFNGDTAADNALDDYEVGNWTPSYGASTTNPTITYDVQDGRYVKVGRLVTCWGRIRTDSVSGGSGDVLIKGLPFTVENLGNVRGVLTVGLGNSWATYRPDQGLAIHNTTNSTLYRSTDAGSSAITVSNLGTSLNNNNLQFMLTYRVA